MDLSNVIAPTPKTHMGWLDRSHLCWCKYTLEIQDRYTNPETNSEFAPENRPKLPQKEMNHLPTMEFSGANCKFQGGYRT